jgi:thiamine monophosphate kinase
LSGGEDYELIFAADKTTVARAKRALGCPVTVIGDITEEQLPARVVVVDSGGTIIPYRKKGWDHFRNAIS